MPYLKDSGLGPVHEGLTEIHPELSLVWTYDLPLASEDGSSVEFNHAHQPHRLFHKEVRNDNLKEVRRGQKEQAGTNKPAGTAVQSNSRR